MQVLDMTLLYDVVLLNVILCAKNIIGMVEFHFVSFTEIVTKQFFPEELLC